MYLSGAVFSHGLLIHKVLLTKRKMRRISPDLFFNELLIG